MASTQSRPLASGIGSWPGTSAREAVREVGDLLGDGHIPFVPELPARGPGADLVGRTASLLPGLSVDLQPSGWRLTGAPGRDARRGAAFLREDLDEVAEAYAEWSGPLKVQLCGPVTLASALALPRGERAVSDPGAVRDISQSLAQAALEHLGRVQTLVPGASLILQIDEPGLPAALSGSLRTSSGLGWIRAMDPGTARDLLGTVVEAVEHRVVVHSCAAEVPVDLIGRLPGVEPSLDLGLLVAAQLDPLGALLEEGRGLWIGALPTDALPGRPDTVGDAVRGLWSRLGLAPAMLSQVVVTPACGLASATADQARRSLRTLRQAADILTEASQG